jgi:hypothetical protein
MPETMFDLGIVRVERVTRIELALSAWEADVLPLNYTARRGDGGKPSSRDATCPDIVPDTIRRADQLQAATGQAVGMPGERCAHRGSSWTGQAPASGRKR